MHKWGARTWRGARRRWTPGSVLFALALIVILTTAPRAAAQQRNAPASGDAAAPAEAAPADYANPNHNPRRPPDAGYDPAADPSHPLKQPEIPEDDWFGGANQHVSTANYPTSSNLGRPAQYNADWDWGELFFDETYETHLLITNDCETAQWVTIQVEDLPYLEGLPPRVRVPGGGQVELPVKIVTPPPPPAPLGYTGGPHWGWVKPPLVPPFGYDFEFHQPYFLEVKGRVRVWHPWSGECPPKLVTYHAAGHIHFKPPPDEDAGDTGPERIATPDPCVVWWLTGERPPDLEGDCLDVLRGLAIAYRQRILPPHVGRDPAAWTWLPDAAGLGAMTTPELFAFKARADALIADAAE